MKLKELLLEVRERLNRTVYGHWISPDNRLLPVEPFMHAEWYANNVLDNPIERFSEFGTEWAETMNHAFSSGWVRVAHPPGKKFIAVDGTREGITRVAPLIIPSLGGYDLSEVAIGIWPANQPAVAAHEQDTFRLPQERIPAMKFLRNEH